MFTLTRYKNAAAGAHGLYTGSPGPRYYIAPGRKCARRDCKVKQLAVDRAKNVKNPAKIWPLFIMSGFA
jgi:hypothetical protein